MVARKLTELEKKQYAKDVGKILVKKYGKQKYYSPYRVRQASKETIWGIDWHCWAMCLYTSPEEFNRYHESIGEACDYASMKAQMAHAITDGASDSWFDFDISWLEWPDFDLPSIFDVFD
jgi:hypothetical protein